VLHAEFISVAKWNFMPPPDGLWGLPQWLPDWAECANFAAKISVGRNICAGEILIDRLLFSPPAIQI
jgi:hypothetical protein